MSDPGFHGHKILTTGSGQCEKCAQCITRVLVDYPGGRQWMTADIGTYGYVQHTCPSPPSSLRKAA